MGLLLLWFIYGCRLVSFSNFGKVHATHIYEYPINVPSMERSHASCDDIISPFTIISHMPLARLNALSHLYSLQITWTWMNHRHNRLHIDDDVILCYATTWYCLFQYLQLRLELRTSHARHSHAVSHWMHWTLADLLRATRPRFSQNYSSDRCPSRRHGDKPSVAHYDLDQMKIASAIEIGDIWVRRLHHHWHMIFVVAIVAIECTTFFSTNEIRVGKKMKETQKQRKLHEPRW